MSFVYILQSELNGHYYIGSTEDVAERLTRHNAGKVSYSKKYRPWKKVFEQEFENRTIAQAVERKLKSWKRRDYLEKIIADGHIRAIPTPRLY